jgi:heterodisulfide reductase subunit D
MGEDEWCCGYPLIVAGMSSYIEPLKEHNLKKIRDIGAKRMIFSCPSCYHTWRNEYRVELEMLHHTEFIKKLIDEGSLSFSSSLNYKVTYHDPCDLGRNSLVYDAPRKVINSIPGIEFVEMKHSREYALCCGGGGDLEVVDAPLPTELGKRVIEEAEAIKVDVLITSCQQCKRTLVNALNGENSLKVMDILELVVEATEGG